MAKLSDIARLLGCAIPGDAQNMEILGIAAADAAGDGSVTFLSDARYADAVVSCKAAAVIVRKGTRIPGKINLEVDDPYAGYAKVALLFEDTTPLYDGPVHPSAVIDPSAHIDPSVYVGPLSVIGGHCVVGENTVIGARCVIEKNTKIGARCRIDSGAIIRRDTVIGNQVIIQSGAVIGSEGFGNALENGRFIRIPCFGAVVIEDDVEIGALTTVDRGNFKPTIIRKGARIDNLVQIAHNVEIGENSAIAAQAGISGSTTVGRGVLIGGQAGFVGHIRIGDGAFVGAKAGVSKDVKPGQKITGYPARDLMHMRRIEAAQQSLPEMRKELKRVREEIEDLKNIEKNRR